MTAAEGILVTLRHFGARVWVDGDQLRVRAPAGMLTPSLRDALRKFKSELVAALADKAESVAPDLARASLVVEHVRALEALGVELGELDHYFERRALLEVDGQLPRAAADLAAALEAVELGARRAKGGDA